MKKVLFALIALVGMFSSCTNDDITISRAITFKVNPATVVENLYERNAGDLTSLSSGAKLQVSLYIYDENTGLAEFKQFVALHGKANAAIVSVSLNSQIAYWKNRIPLIFSSTQEDL